jgi:bifunctional UDP-N-acetylglucosamine pyrophosphorylase/glucosamine-1-phosphate N-acetyltransferase
VPLELAKDLLAGEEVFLFLAGDDIFAYKGQSSTGKLIEDWLNSKAEHALVGAHKPGQDLSMYGVLDVNEDFELQRIVEKPAKGQAPSEHINVVKHLFSRSALDYLAEIKPSPSGEFYLTDIISIAKKHQETTLVSYNDNEWLDCGNLDGWLHANNYLYTRYS